MQKGAGIVYSYLQSARHERVPAMAPEEFAIVTLSGGGLPRVWPTRGRSKESFEEYCATYGVTVIRTYPSLEEAMDALYLPLEVRFAGRQEL